MSALFSRTPVNEPPSQAWVPPPPRAAGSVPANAGPAASLRAAPGRPQSRSFHAEVDCSELDDRDRPGATWVAHTTSISRSSITLRSRRMCYVGRQVVMAVHLIDDRPSALFGRVVSCEYDAEGMHVLDLDLLPVPTSAPVLAWLNDRD